MRAQRGREPLFRAAIVNSNVTETMPSDEPHTGASNTAVSKVTVNYTQTHSSSRLAWSEGWRPSGAQSAFIK